MEMGKTIKHDAFPSVDLLEFFQLIAQMCLEQIFLTAGTALKIWKFNPLVVLVQRSQGLQNQQFAYSESTEVHGKWTRMSKGSGHEKSLAWCRLRKGLWVAKINRFLPLGSSGCTKCQFSGCVGQRQTNSNADRQEVTVNLFYLLR